MAKGFSDIANSHVNLTKMAFGNNAIRSTATCAEQFLQTGLGFVSLTVLAVSQSQADQLVSV